MMLFRALALLICLAAAAPAAHAGEGRTVTAAPTYSSIAADLPLMPGLTEKDDSLVLFDKAEGRIAEITMTGPHAQIAVLDYYGRTLPALGWHAENPQIWRRAGEQLTLRFNADKSVTFHIEPQPKPGRPGSGTPAPH
jgi:hypothetical protein